MLKFTAAVTATLISASVFAYGSSNSGTGAMPTSEAQRVLRAGFEQCRASTTTTEAYRGCMDEVYAKVRDANRKAFFRE